MADEPRQSETDGKVEEGDNRQNPQRHIHGRIAQARKKTTIA
jgi:hypothetical protein